MQHFAPHTHICIIKTHTHSASSRIPSSKIFLVFIIWFQIRPEFSMRCVYGWRKWAAAFALSHVHVCPHSSHFLNFTPHSPLPLPALPPICWLCPDADDIERAGLFLFCQGAARLFPLYLSVCRVQDCTLTPPLLRGLDMLSVEGLCIQNSWG